jgi:hypothetical protein
MWRAVILLGLVLGIVLSSLMLLRRTAGDRAKRQGDRPPPRIELKEEDDR